MYPLKAMIREVYRAILPEKIRNSRIITKLKSQLLSHDWIYDTDYYRTDIEGPAYRSAGKIVDTILSEFRPNRVVDVGCGTGALLQAFQNRGCTVLGLEYSKAALEYCYSRNLNVVKFDLERDILDINQTYDVALSLEVAEHLPERAADRYVDILTRLSPIIIFTAAPPGQGGTDHINEQPPSYWISKFQQLGFKHDEKLSQTFSNNWKASGDVGIWYYRNLMIFRQAQFA